MNNDFRGRARLVRYLAPRLTSRNDRFLTAMINDIPIKLDMENVQEQYMYYGYFGSDIVRTFSKFVSTGDVAVDVGANLGYMSAHLAGLAGGEGEVHAFEPVPSLWERLSTLAVDAGRAGYTIKANAFALADKPGETEIMVRGKENIGWNTIVPDLMPETDVLEKHRIRLDTFDNYMKGSGLEPSRVSLVKIDVEGAEPLVIFGMREFFETGSRPVIVCEMNPHAAENIEVNLEDMFKMLKNYRYETYLLWKRDLHPVEWRELKKGEDAVFLPS